MPSRSCKMRCGHGDCIQTSVVASSSCLQRRNILVRVKQGHSHSQVQGTSVFEGQTESTFLSSFQIACSGTAPAFIKPWQASSLVQHSQSGGCTPCFESRPLIPCSFVEVREQFRVLKP